MSEETTDLAKKEQGTTALAEVHDYGELAGAGFDNQTSDDIAIPYLGLLQALSPSVADGDNKAGQLINTVTGDVFDGEVFVVPVFTEHNYVEWVPQDDGGGFVAVHELNSPFVQETKDLNDDQFKLKTESGNDLVETFTMYCLLLDDADSPSSAMPIVVSFTSSKIKVYRQLMLKLRTVKGRPPLFAFRLGITSKQETSKKNGKTYYNFVVNPVGGSATASMIDPTGEQSQLLAEATALIEAIKSGIAKAAHDSVAGKEGGGGDSEEEPF